MAENGTVAYVPQLPPCDICKMNDGGKTADNELALAAYDSRLNVGGQWAYMCSIHYTLYGLGELGIGKGQRLVVRDETRDAAIARHPAGKGL